MNKIYILFIIVLLPQFLYATTNIYMAALPGWIILLLIKSNKCKQQTGKDIDLKCIFNIGKKAFLPIKANFLEFLYSFLFIIFGLINFVNIGNGNYIDEDVSINEISIVLVVYSLLILFIFRFFFYNLLADPDKGTSHD